MNAIMSDEFAISPEIGSELVNPSAYADGSIHSHLAWLREHNPVGLATVTGFDPFWVVSRHADILAVSRNNALFQTQHRSILMMDSASVQKTIEQTGTPNVVSNLFTMDPPEHDKYRRIAQEWFSPRGIKAREDRIRSIAREMIDRMAACGDECDFVSVVSTWYPLRVIMEILGIPPAHEPLMLKLTKEMVGVDDPDLFSRGRKGVFSEDFLAVIGDFHSYFRNVMQERRLHPSDDVASIIANATIDGQPIDDENVLGYYTAIASAGHETTAASTAGAVLALATFPAIFAAVKANRSLIPKFVDETIRWICPVQHFMRTATSGYVLRGRNISKGDWIMLSYLSGNRDEQVFPEPFDFRLDRSPNPHVSFGHGAHICLGMHLAKMEIRIVLEELLARLVAVEVTAEPKRSEALFAAGLKTLPIRFQLA